jgi:uncharacterized integral membrane protein
MKKVKIAIWVVIVGFVALLIYQNKALFLTGNTLRLNLGFVEYQTADMRILLLCFLFLLAGLLLGVYFLVVQTLKAKKLVKAANKRVETQKDQIASLESELKRYRGQPPPAAAESSDADAKTVVINPQEQKKAEKQK